MENQEVDFFTILNSLSGPRTRAFRRSFLCPTSPESKLSDSRRVWVEHPIAAFEHQDLHG